MAIQVNYPGTTFHLSDTTSSDMSATGLLLFDGSGNVLSQVSQTTIQIHALNPNDGKNELLPTSHTITNGDITGTASRTVVESDSVEFQSFTGGVKTESTLLTKNSLLSDVSVFDVSLNALTLGGVASTTGQVITANADGKPVWSTLPSEVIPTLSQVLVAGNSADSTVLNMNLQQIQNSGIITVVESLAAEPPSQTQVWSDHISIFNAQIGTSTSSEYRGELLRFSGYDGTTTTSVTTYEPTQISTNVDFNLAFPNVALKLNGTTGSNGQVITSNADGTPSWQDPALNCGLADVLTNSSDATNQPINNLSLLTFNKVTGGSQEDTVLELKGVNPDPSIYTTDILNINTPANTTRATKQFSGNYIPLSVGGTVYWLQLFSAP